MVKINEALDRIGDGSVVMVGGFLACGTPEPFIDYLVERGVKNLTVICNDSGFPDRGAGRLVVNKQVKRLITSHIGTNPETGRQMSAGELEVILVPQGTLAERIRCGGNGLGGFLTPTGVGTEVAAGKKVIIIEGMEYLLEMPLRADFALLSGSVVDTAGNAVHLGTTKNFQPLMASAADCVIIYAEKLVEKGEIDPNHVDTPGIFIDYIVA
jgi:acetate CoA/acetoacetate CoA-transferase alpha subunit